jgi:hypothetical protein
VATKRVAPATVIAAAVPTSADTAVVSTNPGAMNPAGQNVLVRADCVLYGATNVTGVTITIHRGQTVAGATVYATSAPITVAGAVTVEASVAFRDSAYDGTGYTLSMQAAGAAATADVTLESQVLDRSY